MAGWKSSRSWPTRHPTICAPGEHIGECGGRLEVGGTSEGGGVGGVLGCLQAASAILVGGGEDERGEVLLGDHLELGVFAADVSVVVEVASRVGSSTGRGVRSLRARTRLRPSVGLDRRDTGRDLWVGREDLTELAPEGSLALDVGEAVRRSVVLGLVQEGARSAERHGR